MILTTFKVPGDEQPTPTAPGPHAIPDSPPPSFRSRASSLSSSRWNVPRNATNTSVDRTLEDTFDAGDSDNENNDDDRQRLMRNIGSHARAAEVPSETQRTDSGQQRIVSPPRRNTPFTTFSSSNDGVFANLNAKPERGEKLEELPPVSIPNSSSFSLAHYYQSYEQAAADATPPYWETTILAPGMVSDEVYIDGLPVGSFFSFAWNAMISMAFQLVGFLLTYLLHTTHAARNGSRAGLGVTLINYGFTMKKLSSRKQGTPDAPYGEPSNPNSHDFDPAAMSNAAAVAAASNPGASSQPSTNFLAGDWISYMLMIVGWIILIKAVSDFVKARRHEQLILQSPERGLSVPIVAENESAERVV